MSTVVKAGRFGMFGGQYVPETLMNALTELEREYKKSSEDQKFWVVLPSKSLVDLPRCIRCQCKNPWQRRLFERKISITLVPTDQQCDRPLLAKKWADADHCGNRRWAAWRCHSYNLRHDESDLRDLHGRRCPKAGAERISNGALGAKVNAVAPQRH